MSFFTTEKGSTWLSGLFTMLILTMVLFIGVELVCYFSSYWKLRVAGSETLALMKLENGFDAQTKQYFYNFLKIQGLDPIEAEVEVQGTPKIVQRGDVLTLETEMPYVFKALRPLGKEFNLKIKVALSGLAQEFVK